MCSRDWNTDSCVDSESTLEVRRAAPCVAYDDDKEDRFANAERPTPRPRRDDIARDSLQWRTVLNIYIL